MKNRSTKITVIGLCAAFVIPVILAKLALEQQWFTNGATNKGELLQPVSDLSAILDEQQPKWRLIYSVPAKCDKACENAIFSIHQVWLALGRESDRAEAAVLISETSDKAVTEKIASSANVHVISVAQSGLNNTAIQTKEQAIYLVDTLNNAMLRYPVFASKEAAIQSSRDMLSDVKKLLKLSRIG